MQLTTLGSVSSTIVTRGCPVISAIVNSARLYYLSALSVANRALPLKKDVQQ